MRSMSLESIPKSQNTADFDLYAYRRKAKNQQFLESLPAEFRGKLTFRSGISI
jgi:hypothetical protein